MRNIIINWLSKVILKIIPADIKMLYRNVEKSNIKLCTIMSHYTFNTTCLNNNLLPNYTNVRLHNEVTRTEDFVLDFRRKLLTEEINKQLELGKK